MNQDVDVLSGAGVSVKRYGIATNDDERSSSIVKLDKQILKILGSIRSLAPRPAMGINPPIGRAERESGRWSPDSRWGFPTLAKAR
jgi:hypothetical protein